MALTRKDLKHDRFVEEVGHQVAFFAAHRKLMLAVAAVVAVIVVGTVAFTGYQERQRKEANAALLEAVRLYHGAVTLDPRPGFVTFATTGERVRRTSEALEQVADEFSGRPEAAAARYYLGLLSMEQENYEEARGRLEQAVDEGDETYSSLARLALAQTLARLELNPEARAQYDELVANPSLVVPVERARLALARFLLDTEPEAAKAMLEEMSQSSSPASMAATAELRRLAGS